MKKDDKTNEILLDLTECKYVLDIHKAIKEAFGFPDWYGMNWSACWDLLREPRETNVYVRILGINSLPKSLKESGSKIIELLERTKEYYSFLQESISSFDISFEYIIAD